MRSMEPARRDVEKELSQVKASAQSFGLLLEREHGIKSIELGVGLPIEGKFSIGVTIRPVHGLTPEQMQAVKAYRSYEGNPVSVAIVQSIPVAHPAYPGHGDASAL